MGNSVFLATDVTERQQAKLTRIARGLRQVDVASQARVTVTDVITVEKDRWLPNNRKYKILRLLGLMSEKKSDLSR